MKNRTSPTLNSVNAGGPTPNDPIHGVTSDFMSRDPDMPRIFVGIGMVVDVFPLHNSCLVMGGFELKIACTYGAVGASNVTGVMSTYTPSVGDQVVYVYQFESHRGVIVGGVIPKASSIPGSKPTTPIWGEEYLPTWAIINDPETFKCKKLAFGSPSAMVQEDLVSGEMQAMSECHVGTVQGKMYYRIQAGQLAAVNFNLIDSVVDFVAHNFKFFNSGFKIDSFCDYGRTNTEILTSPCLETFVIDQNNFHTIKLFSGWFAAGIAIQTNKTKGQLHADVWNDELGIHSIRTTVAAWLSKQNGIYIPNKLCEPDDPLGKGDKEIEEKAPRKGFKIDPKDQHPASFGCMARDYAAWQTSGEYRFKRFEEYKKDWELKGPDAETNFQPPGLDSGQYCSFMPVQQAVSPVPATPDDYSNYRNGEAFCGVLPDGSVLLRDAWGSSIELRGGKIVITNPKDTEIISGHNTILISGNDTIIKSNNSLDLNTTNKNVRIRSGRHTMIDAKQGSIQLTALAASAPKLRPMPGDEDQQIIADKYRPTGITFRTNAQVTSIAPSISNITSGIFSILSLDDEGGDPIVYIKSSATVDWTNGYLNFALNDEEGNRLYVWRRDKSVLITGGNLMAGSYGVFERSAIIYEIVIAGEHLMAVESLYVNEDVASVSNGPYVKQLDPDYPVMLPKDEPKRIEGVENFGKAVINLQMIGNARYLYLANDTADRTGQPWRKYDNVLWHYRKVEEYGTKEFLWFQNFWQRQYEDSLVEWSSGKTDIDSERMAVYPGNLYITEDSPCYVTYSEANVEKDGTPKLPKDQKDEGGTFEKKKYLAMKFHPPLGK